MKILSRCMKPPPDRWPRHGIYKDLITGMVKGECVELDAPDFRRAQADIKRAAMQAGIRATTRKSDRGTLEVYRLS